MGTVFYTGLTEPLDYTFGVEQDFDLEDLGGKSKQTIVRTGPTSVVVTVKSEDPATHEVKNIVFHPHGAEIRSSLSKAGTFMTAQLYEWYDRIDEEGNNKTNPCPLPFWLMPCGTPASRGPLIACLVC